MSLLRRSARCLLLALLLCYVQKGCLFFDTLESQGIGGRVQWVVRP